MVRFFVILALLAAAAMTGAAAAELRLIGQATTGGALRALVPPFEQQSGDRVEMTLGNPTATLARLRATEAVDIVVVNNAILDTLLAEQRIDATTRLPLGDSRIGMAIAAGVAKPPFADKADFIAYARQLVSIGLVDPKTSGTSPPFIKAVEALGLAAELAPKYRIFEGAGDAVADAIARHEVEAGISTIPELITNKGVEVIGPIPPDVLQYSSTTYAFVGAHSASPDEARKFLALLASPAGAAAFRAIGLGPAQ